MKKITTIDLSAAAEFKRLQSEATGESWERYGNIGHSGGLRMVRCEIERDRTDRAIYTQIPATDKDAVLMCAAKHTDLPERIEQLVARVQELEAIVTKAQRLFSVCEFSEPIDLTELNEIMECGA